MLRDGADGTADGIEGHIGGGDATVGARIQPVDQALVRHMHRLQGPKSMITTATASPSSVPVQRRGQAMPPSIRRISPAPVDPVGHAATLHWNAAGARRRRRDHRLRRLQSVHVANQSLIYRLDPEPPTVASPPPI
ncbi:transporter, major facilitator family protein [Mycobacteroides abscessus]|nr:transporter, major facilitator family protein [Mycobacteroides abscessus]